MATSSSAGGFIPSPPPSSALSHTTTSSTATRLTLPHPRATPLRPGGSKESAFIRHVDQRILQIQRRFAKRTAPQIPTSRLAEIDHDHDGTEMGLDAPAETWASDVAGGYASMGQPCADISELVDVVWVSGTPGLQVPYLINLALLLSTIVPAMPLSARSLFRCLGKMDHCFASLIMGRDIEMGEALPGFVGRRGVSGTEKVRIRSLVERTRVSVVEAVKRGEFDEEPVERENEETDTDMDGELVLDGEDLEMGEDEDGDEESYDMQLARVYDRTIQELGGTLEGPGIRVVTERRG